MEGVRWFAEPSIMCGTNGVVTGDSGKRGDAGGGFSYESCEGRKEGKGLEWPPQRPHFEGSNYSRRP
mgnify:CR=1 FL=1